MTTLRIQTAAVFRPLLQPARYLGAYGGRGSGKSNFFGELMVEQCLMVPGTSAVCVREVQRSLMQSSKRMIETKIQQLGVGDQFQVLHDRIETPGNGLIIFQGMQDATAESIKSLENFRIAWIEEAQTLSARSLSLLRPTIRAKGSQIWASWNPRRKSDAIDDFLRAKRPDNAIVVKANWAQNPWFPAELEEERKLDLELYPERYAHIWEGDYARAFEGAYFAKHLEQARKDGRISNVAVDPMLPVKAFFDIGGAGHSSDAMAIWICQFVGREIRLLDYIEGVSQPLSYYAGELRRRGWKEAIICWPHDGVATNNVSGRRYIDHWRDAGFECETPIKNSGAGAAMMRIEAARRIFPRCWFDEKKTEAGRDALGYYHERRDENRNVGLGPEHDWSSHAADAFGYLAAAYDEPPMRKSASDWRRFDEKPRGSHWSA
jgi:phage terminase large subunit